MPSYNPSTEGFSSDEAIANLASLYNKDNLTVTKLSTSAISGLPNLQINGTVSIPGQVSVPSLDKKIATLQTQISGLQTQIAGLQTQINNCVKKNTNFTICDAKHGKCIVAGNTYNGNLYHQVPEGRLNAMWKISQ